MNRTKCADGVHAALFGLLVAAAAHADTFIWDGGGVGTNWSVDANWVGNVEPDNDGTARIVFGATSKTNTVLDHNWNINQLHFDDVAPIMNMSGIGSAALTIQANVGLGYGLSNFSPGVDIQNDVVLGGSQFWLNTGGAMGFFGDVALGNHTLDFFNNGSIVLFAGVLSGTASSHLVKSGTGELALYGNGINTHTGLITVNQGRLTLAKAVLSNPAVFGSLVIGDGVGGVEVDRVVLGADDQIDGGADVLVNSSGLLDLNGHNEGISDLTLVGGRVRTDDGTLTLSEVATLASPTSAMIMEEPGGTLSLGFGSGTTIFNVADGSAADDLVVDGSLTGPAGSNLQKTGPGSMVVQGGVNSYTGTTFVTAGTLLLKQSISVTMEGGIPGDLVVGTPAGPDIAVVRLGLNSQIHEAAGNEVRVRRFGVLDANGWTDDIGPLVLEGGTVLTGNGAFTVGFGVHTEAVPQTATITGNLNLNGAAKTFDIEDGSAFPDLRVAAALTNGGLTKTGAGSMTLQIGSTYAGPTVINGGRILVTNGSGSATGSGPVAVNALARLGGTGSVAGGVSVGAMGTISPGIDGVGALHVGAVAFANTANIDIEIGGLTPGTQFDQLIVAGDAFLNGSANVVMVGPFVPQVGDEFEILTAGGNVTGQFNTTGQSLPQLPGGRGWRINYNPGDVTLEVLLLGDYNGNGVVDAPDYVVWRNTLGQSPPGLAADGNGSGTIDQGDYNVWRANFGKTAGSGSSSSVTVPEPLCASMLLLGAAVGAMARRRVCSQVPSTH